MNRYFQGSFEPFVWNGSQRKILWSFFQPPYCMSHTFNVDECHKTLTVTDDFLFRDPLDRKYGAFLRIPCLVPLQKMFLYFLRNLSVFRLVLLFIPGCCKLQSLGCVRLFCDPVNHSPPGFCVHGISQARTLEWVAISFSRSNPGIGHMSPALQEDSLSLSHRGSPYTC